MNIKNRTSHSNSNRLPAFFSHLFALRHSLVFRLTSWFAAMLVFTAAFAFILFYLFITSVFHQRTDDDLYAQSNELAAIFAMQGDMVLQQTALMQTQAAGEKQMFFRMLYASGVVFSSSNMAYWKNIGIDRQAVEAVIQGGQHQFVTQVIPGQTHGVRVLYRRIGPAIVLQLGYSLEDVADVLDTFQQVFLFTMALLLLLAVILGWFMARRALAGVQTVTRTARRISESDLDTRVPVGRRHDEIDRLAITFNQMLDRIRTLVNGVRHLSDNIAHDLRSPITRIRGLAEVTLTGDSHREDYARMAGSTIEECDRLLDMINTMLTISRTETGVDRQTFQPVDMAAMIHEACELFQPIADDRQVALSCQADGPALLTGDRHMLQRLTANLVDNAIKYSPSGAEVVVDLRKLNEGHMALVVSDNGIGIAVEDQQRVFDRFFRGDQSRSQSGAGLGLSLAQAIAQAHGGTISLESTPGKGSVFTVTLPLEPIQNS